MIFFTMFLLFVSSFSMSVEKLLPQHVANVALVVATLDVFPTNLMVQLEQKRSSFQDASWLRIIALSYHLKQFFTISLQFLGLEFPYVLFFLCLIESSRKRFAECGTTMVYDHYSLVSGSSS